LPLSRRPYLLDDGGLTIGAGVVQIRDYAKENDDKALSSGWSEMQRLLRLVKTEFFKAVTDEAGLDYFGPPKKTAASERPQTITAQVERA
jgi:hypothetical protein